MSAISIRHVLFGPGLPIDERLTYVAALLFGVSLASALGLCMGFCMRWLESMASDAVSIAGCAFIVPVGSPRHLNFAQVVFVAVLVAMAMSRIGAARVARVLASSLAIYHVAHELSAVIAVLAMAVEDARKEQAGLAAQVGHKLERVLIFLVRLVGVVASLRETSIPQDASLAIGEQRAHLGRERVLVPFLPLAQLLEAQRRVIKRTKLGAGALAHG